MLRGWRTLAGAGVPPGWPGSEVTRVTGLQHYRQRYTRARSGASGTLLDRIEAAHARGAVTVATASIIRTGKGGCGGVEIQVHVFQRGRRRDEGFKCICCAEVVQRQGELLRRQPARLLIRLRRSEREGGECAECLQRVEAIV